MSNYSSYFAIEKQLKHVGFNASRDEIIHQFTDGKKCSLKSLSTHEYREMIAWLNQLLQKMKPMAEDRCQIQRRKVIALLVKIGYTKNDKADMDRIYDWVLKYGYLHKPFNTYNVNELSRLVSQAEQFYKHHINGL